jgi:Iap family predicted aminopeptidase
MARTYTAVVTKEGCKEGVRCGHKHHTASAAHRCGDKNREHFAVLTIEGSDGKPVTLADFAVTGADYRKANVFGWSDVYRSAVESLLHTHEEQQLRIATSLRMWESPAYLREFQNDWSKRPDARIDLYMPDRDAYEVFTCGQLAAACSLAITLKKVKRALDPRVWVKG